jgi:hypothetical protein
MECNQARPLIQGYLDGELSETQATPLRRHLLDCQPCRGNAQAEKNLKRWFTPDPAISVPHGFAARVARRAFAGDTGEREIEILPAGRSSLAARAAVASAAAPRTGMDDPLLRFVLQVTAAAALIVIAFSVALRGSSLPAGTSLRAADGRSEMTVEQAVENLDRLNRVEPGAAKSTDPGAKPPGAAAKGVEIHRP